MAIRSEGCGEPWRRAGSQTGEPRIFAASLPGRSGKRPARQSLGDLGRAEGRPVAAQLQIAI